MESVFGACIVHKAIDGHKTHLDTFVYTTACVVREREGEAEREREMNDAYKPIILELILDHLSHKFVAIAKWKRFDCSNAYQNEPNKWFTVS